MAKATWKNTIGSTELVSVWTDPDFDAGQSAFYYARVIEIPTPRWTAYEAQWFGVEMTPNVPMATQERAYYLAALVRAIDLISWQSEIAQKYKGEK